MPTKYYLQCKWPQGWKNFNSFKNIAGLTNVYKHMDQMEPHVTWRAVEKVDGVMVRTGYFDWQKEKMNWRKYNEKKPISRTKRMS